MISISDDFSVLVCSANDLVIYKCIAGRDKDLHDVATVINRSFAVLDVPYIRQTLREFEIALATSELSTVFEKQLKKSRSS